MAQPQNLLETINVALIRLDAKVDNKVELILSGMKDVKEGFTDHETRLRVIERTPRIPVEEFEKLRDNAVSVGTLWKVATLLASAVGILLTIINVVLK